MSLAVLVGDDTTLSAALADALSALSFDVVDGPSRKTAGAELLVTVCSPGGPERFGTLDLDAWRAAVDGTLHRVAAAVEAFAPTVPEPVPDELGERRAVGSVIHVIDHPVGLSRSRHAAFAVVTDAMAAMTRVSAVQLAPRIRINAIVPANRHGARGTSAEAQLQPPAPRLDATPAALIPTLKHLLATPAITGQLVSLQPQRA